MKKRLEQEFSVKELKQDFDFLRKSLEEGHFGLYRHRTQEEMRSRFDEAYSLLNKQMNILEFYRIVAPVIYLMGDGHTLVLPDLKLYHYILNEIGVFPIKPVFIKKKLYVYRNYSKNENLSIGTEIISINNIPSQKIIETLLPFVQIDGFGEERKLDSLELRFDKLLLLVYGINTECEIECFDHISRERKKTKVQLMKKGEIRDIHMKRYPSDFSQPLYDLEIFDELNAARVKIKSFLNSKKYAKLTGSPEYRNYGNLKNFLKHSFKQINEKNVQNLILDLRDNSGGREDLVIRLYRYIARNPFQFFEGLYLKKKEFKFLKEAGNKTERFLIRIVRKEETEQGYKIHNFFFMVPLYKIFKPKKNPFEGNVFILINGNTFSVSAEFASVCHHLGRAKLIGEETKGGYIGNSSGLTVSLNLPNTKMFVSIPLFKYVMPVPQKDNHRGIIPDYKVEKNIEDIIEGKDTQLNFTLDLIKNS
jgi:hypothetical protein